MSDFEQEQPDNGEEKTDGEEPGESAGWEETNDEPAQGEGEQDIV
jgi:hypothetical protein